MSATNMKPPISASNQVPKKEKKEYTLVVAPPSVKPGGVMPPPQSKGGVEGTGISNEEFTFNSLVSSISALSPWAEPAAATEDVEDLSAVEVKPEDALEFFQKQTSSMDREALLARVAEAAAREADAVTKLGQLTFKLAAKEKLMDDLRAGLVAAGRAVTEAQQEAEAVKKQVAQQEAALAAKYGTTIDVLKRLGEVTAKLDAREAALEQAKTELMNIKKSSMSTESDLTSYRKESSVREAELTAQMAAAKKAAVSREVELSTALAAAKAAAQKALAAAAAARAERTNEIIDVLSAKESQVEGLMTALDACKVEKEIIEDEGIDEEDKEEIAEKEDLIRSLLKDLAQAYNMRLGADLSEYSVQEVETLKTQLVSREIELGVMRKRADNVGAYSVAEIEELKRDIADREAELGISVSAAGDIGKEIESMRSLLAARDRELASTIASARRAGVELDGAASGKATAEELKAMSKEALTAQVMTLETQIEAAQQEINALRAAGSAIAAYDSSGNRKMMSMKEADLSMELQQARAAHEATKQQYAAALAARESLIEGLKGDFAAARKQLAQAEKDKDTYKRELRDRESSLQAELSGVKGSQRASEAAHTQQMSAKDAAVDSLRADLAAARRAIAAAEADIVSIKKASATREAQLKAELHAARTSYEVLKLAAAAAKVSSADGTPSKADHTNGVTSVPPELLYKPGELTAQLAAREAQVESLRAELLAVRRAVTAAEEEAQSRREAMAALEAELGAELQAAKAAHEAAELAAAELATNAAANAQNAANMMSMLSEQLQSERETRRGLEGELRAERDQHPDRPHITAAQVAAAEAAAVARVTGKSGGGGLGGLFKGIVAGVAAGLATTVALGGSKSDAQKRRGRSAKQAPAAAVVEAAAA